MSDGGRYADLHAPLLPILRRAIPAAGLPESGLVLDLGCGDGAKWPLYAELLGPGVRLLGVDVDLAALREGPAGLRAAADARALPLAGSLDGALCVAALGGFADGPRALAELLGALRPGAPALVVAGERRWARAARWPAALAARLAEAGAHLRPPADEDVAGDLLALLRGAGFAEVWGRAFLLEDGPAAAAAELALTPWGAVEGALAAALSPAELAEARGAALAAEPELVDVALVAGGRRP